MKKKNKLFIILFTIILLFIFCFSAFSVDVGGYGTFNIYSYEYDSNVNNISYELLYKNDLLIIQDNNTYEWGFIDFCLSIMGLNYDFLNITEDNEDILATLPQYVNTGQAYAYNHDYTQINLTKMVNFITNYNKLTYSVKNTYFTQLYIALRLNETLRVGIIKNVNVILDFLLLNNLIDRSNLVSINNNIKNYMLYSTDVSVLANNEYSYYNIFLLSGNYYQHIRYELINVSNSQFDVIKSRDFLLDIANWSFMPTVITNVIIACLSAIFLIGTAFGIFNLAKKVI